MLSLKNQQNKLMKTKEFRPRKIVVKNGEIRFVLHIFNKIDLNLNLFVKKTLENESTQYFLVQSRF